MNGSALNPTGWMSLSPQYDDGSNSCSNNDSSGKMLSQMFAEHF